MLLEEMFDRMSSWEWSHRLANEEFDPIGTYRADLQTASIVAKLHNLWTAEEDHMSISDALPDFGQLRAEAEAKEAEANRKAGKVRVSVDLLAMLRERRIKKESIGGK